MIIFYKICVVDTLLNSLKGFLRTRAVHNVRQLIKKEERKRYDNYSDCESFSGRISLNHYKGKECPVKNRVKLKAWKNEEEDPTDEVVEPTFNTNFGNFLSKSTNVLLRNNKKDIVFNQQLMADNVSLKFPFHYGEGTVEKLKKPKEKVKSFYERFFEESKKASSQDHPKLDSKLPKLKMKVKNNFSTRETLKQMPLPKIRESRSCELPIVPPKKKPEKAKQYHWNHGSESKESKAFTKANPKSVSNIAHFLILKKNKQQQSSTEKEIKKKNMFNFNTKLKINQESPRKKSYT